MYPYILHWPYTSLGRLFIKAGKKMKSRYSMEDKGQGSRFVYCMTYHSAIIARRGFYPAIILSTPLFFLLGLVFLNIVGDSSWLASWSSLPPSFFSPGNGLSFRTLFRCSFLFLCPVLFLPLSGRGVTDRFKHGVREMRRKRSDLSEWGRKKKRHFHESFSLTHPQNREAYIFLGLVRPSWSSSQSIV